MITVVGIDRSADFARLQGGHERLVRRGVDVQPVGVPPGSPTRLPRRSIRAHRNLPLTQPAHRQGAHTFVAHFNCKIGKLIGKFS